MSASTIEVQKPKEHRDNTGIKLLKLMKKSYTPNLSTVGFIYEVLTNLQSNPRDLILNLSSLERKVRMKDEKYALGR
ncbi:hypothetical protein JXA31_07005 [Candidatus Bathyarchaeota archaeon]|nr:hypothetical protein [Candidatus Bathyarchaeota archaeon]